MKKTLSIILALVLCLSLCACGGEPTETQNNLLTKGAPEANFKTIYEKCNENIVATKNDYVGKGYQFAGIVKNIAEDSITLAPIKFPTYPYGSWYYVKVFLPTDDIVKVSSQQIINVAGEISDLKGSSAEMRNGVLLDDNIAFEGEITGFFLNESYTKHIMEVKMTNGTNNIHYWLEVADADKMENITEITINGISFVVGDKVSGTGKMEAYGAYSNRFNVVEVLSIEKN